MKMKTVVASAFALTMLAGCSKPQESLPSDSSSTGPAAEEILNGFETSLKGTAKVTYDAKYKVDVISEKGGMDGFKHDVDDKTVAEFDLTEGDLYLYVKRDAKEPSTVTTPVTREALLYKDGAKYKYVTTVMENPVELANEAAARAKVDELLERISGNLAGYVDTTSFVYAKDNAYEHKEFGLSTGNITAEDFMEAPTYAKNDANGLKITNSLDYVGYHTDAGISDFEGHDGKPASTYEVNTNEKGYVTSYVQNIDSQCVMNIMTPAPTVTIKGTKAATAKFGEALTKKTEITHQLTTTKLTITDTPYGTIETFMTPTIGGTLTPVAAGTDLTVGQFLAVKVTPAGANTIKMVTFANSSKDVADNDNYFYFEIPEGKANLTINFVGSDQVAGAKMGTMNVTASDDITYTAVWFTLVNGSPDSMKPVTDNKVPVGKDNWIAYKVVVPEGRELITATVGGKNITYMMESYCINVKEEKTYEVKFESGEPVVPTYGSLVAPAAVPGASVKYTTCGFGEWGQPAEQVVMADTQLVVGKLLNVYVTPVEGATITEVKINGKAVEANHGIYAGAVVLGENKVEITMGGTLPTTAKVNLVENADVTKLDLKPFTIGAQGKPAYTDTVAANSDVVCGAGKFVELDATFAEGKVLDKIYVNGVVVEPQQFGPFTKYFFEAKVAGVYDVRITTKAAA